MGVVYLAKDPALGRTVAIKMLMEDNEELRERFAREARSAAALKHNNIVTIYDVGEDDGHPFIAMEFLDGETMARAVSLGLARPFEVVTPLVQLHKEDVIALGDRLGVPLALTLSCMSPRRDTHCGLCSKCRERQDAFRMAGIVDPTEYAAQWAGRASGVADL